MFRYILKRILIFIPTLLVISIVIFMLSVIAPGDPVEKMLGATPEGEPIPPEAYNAMRKQLGLDLPVFYFSLSSKAYPDTLYRLPKKIERENLSRLIDQYGNWPLIDKYHKSAKKLSDMVYMIDKDSLNQNALIKLKQNIGNLELTYEDFKINKSFEKIGEFAVAAPSTEILVPQYQEVVTNYNAMKANPTLGLKKIPALHWFGFNNQYHRWISKFVQFDFGRSFRDKRPIGEKIGDYIYWTMIISLISIVLTYLMAIPLGVFSARKKDTRADALVTTVLFILYSLPSFWVATLLINFLCQPAYVEWFPPYGLGNVTEATPFFEKIGIRAYHLILPLFCWTYGSLAFLSRQMRGGMLSVLRQDFVRTARAKGLPENKVIWKHAFRNSLLPIITLFANVFPLMISGSIVIEVIFTIPGMGRELFEAIKYPDYPMVFTIVMLASLLTMIGYLIADILYAVVDPRITFK